MKRTTIAAPLVLLLGLAGCSSTTSATPSTPHGRVTTEPAADHTPARPPYLLRHDGIGKLSLGMTQDAAWRSGDLAERNDAPADDGNRWFLRRAPKSGVCMAPADRLTAVLTGDRRVHTPEGIRVGSTRAQLLAAYPDAKPYPADEPGTPPGIYKVPLGAHVLYEIDLEHGKVSMLILRLDAQDCFE